MTDIVELGTKECVEVALYMYEEWQKAMKPPLFAYYAFPDWLLRLSQQDTPKTVSQQRRGKNATPSPPKELGK